MKGEILETDWKFPVDFDGVVKTVYRAPLKKEDGALPFHEQWAVITKREMSTLQPDDLQCLMMKRAAEARKRLEEILEKET